jgi:hypothetical protein
MFPTLIDQIFEDAPTESLLVLRRVCKSWKERADYKIAGHIIVNESPLYSWAPRSATTPSGHIPSREWLLKMVDHVRVLDIHSSRFPLWVASMKRLEAVRFHPPESAGAIFVRPSRTLNFRPGYMLDFTGTPEDVVLSIKTQSGWFPSRLPMQGRMLPRSLTIIIQHEDLPLPVAEVAQIGFFSKLFAQLLQRIAVQLHLALTRVRPEPYTALPYLSSLTLVGIEQWFQLFRFFGRGGTLPDPYQGRPIYRNRGELDAAIRRRLALMGLSAEDNQDAMSRLQYRTCEEYRAIVGTDEFLLQTEGLLAVAPGPRRQRALSPLS